MVEQVIRSNPGFRVVVRQPNGQVIVPAGRFLLPCEDVDAWIKEMEGEDEGDEEEDGEDEENGDDDDEDDDEDEDDEDEDEDEDEEEEEEDGEEGEPM
jgi:hypothetical protein